MSKRNNNLKVVKIIMKAKELANFSTKLVKS